MSETLLAALWKSRSPEEFAERYLLRALKVRALPVASLSGPRGRRFRELLRSLGRGDFHNIAFVNEASPNRVCFFQVGRTVLGGRALAVRKTHPLPKATLFTFGSFNLNALDYRRAASVTGERIFEHPGPEASSSYNLLIPLELLDHGEWTARLRKPPARISAGTINVVLKKLVFEKLEQHHSLQAFLERYLCTLSFLKGELGLGHYRQVADLKAPRGKVGETPYKVFHALYQKYRPLLQQLPRATSLSDVERLLELHLKTRGHFARDYAKRIWGIIQSPGGRADATKIAGDAKLPIREIR